MPVGRQLDAGGKPPFQVLHELRSTPAVPGADQPGRHELGVRVNRGEGPDIAHAELALHLRRHVLRLGVDEAPNLVHLEALTGEVPEHPVLVLRAGGSEVEQELLDGVLGDADHPGRGADGVAVDQGRHELGAFRGAEDVCHDVTIMLERSGIAKPLTAHRAKYLSDCSRYT